MSSAAQDLIKRANFWEDRLRGFGAAKGRILAFSIDLLHRLQNTLALPCECVMDHVHCCQLINYSHAYRPALTMLLAGWRPIGSS